MRPVVLAAVLCSSSLLMAHAGAAQVFNNETPPPAVTAASASWQVNGEPVFYAGAFYDPSGTTQFFDGKVMVRTGVYQGVPLYEDGTRQPYSAVLVPVGGALMRPYVRRTTVDGLAATTGRAPLTPSDAELLKRRAPEYALVPIGTLGLLRNGAQPATDREFQAVGVVSVAPSQRTSDGDGLWIEYEGARWFSAGRAVDYDPARFEPAGMYRGFQVYRERSGFGNRIYVTVAHDGPLAPFDRR